MNLINNTQMKNNEKKIIYWDTETNGKNKEKIRIYDQIAFKAFERGDNHGNAFFESNPPPFSLITPGAYSARGLDMSFFSPEIMAGKPNNLEMVKRVFNFFNISHNYNFIGQNSSFDEKALIDTAFQNCFTQIYQHKFNKNVLTDLQEFTKAYAFINEISLKNEKEKKFSLAQEFISSVFLSNKKTNSISQFNRHDARFDVLELDSIFKFYINTNPELKKYMDIFYNNKYQILNYPMHLECDWHWKRGAKSRYVMIFNHHPIFGKNWMIKILLNADWLTSRPISELPNLIKKNLEVKSLKTTQLSFIWPIGSKIFERFCPNCCRKELQQVKNFLSTDNEFWNIVQNKFKRENTSKNTNIYQFKYDGPISNNDQNNSMKFHRSDPSQKMLFVERFDDPRLVINAKRIMLYYYSEHLDYKTKKLIMRDEIDELFKENSSRVTFKDCHKDFDLLQNKGLPQKKQQRLEEYLNYIKKLEKNPEIMLGA